MKICDRCYRCSGDSVPGAISATVDVEQFDLCKSCSEELREFIHNPPKPEPTKRKPGRPKKTAQAG